MKEIKLKRIIAFILSIVLIISSPFTVLANGTVGGANGGDVSTGTGGSGNAGYSDDYKAWSSSRQGYRFYIIDNNFIRVSPIYDFPIQ